MKRGTWYNIPRKGDVRKFDRHHYTFSGYTTNKHDLVLEKHDLRRKGFMVRTVQKKRPDRYEMYIKRK
jgi:hypothetical protein